MDLGSEIQKKMLESRNFRKKCLNMNQHREDAMHASFQEKGTALTFLAHI